MARSEPNRTPAGGERALPSPRDARDVAQAMGTWVGAFLAGFRPDREPGSPSPPRPTELAFIAATEGAVLAGLLTRLSLETAREAARRLGQGLLDLAGPPAPVGSGTEPMVAAQWRPAAEAADPGAPAGRGPRGAVRRPEANAPIPRPVAIPALAADLLPALARAALAPGGLQRAAAVAGAAGRSLPALLRGLEAAALAREALREQRPPDRG
jgi:hypothetical protein